MSSLAKSLFLAALPLAALGYRETFLHGSAAELHTEKKPTNDINGGESTMKSTAARRKRPNLGPSPERLSFMWQKLKEDRHGAASGLFSQELNPAPRDVIVPKGGLPKVAFIFLLMDGVDNEEVWETFFEGAKKESYSIYTHRARPGDGPAPLKQLGARALPQVTQAWCALTGLEVSVLANALQDTANTQFVLLSQNAVPLKSFDYIYTRLVQESPATSKICYASPAQKPLFKDTQWDNEVHSRCTFRDFYQRYDPIVRKHHQWVILAREHAYVFVNRSEDALQTYNIAWQKAAPDLKNGFEGCSDEAVVSTALLLDLAERRKARNSSMVTTRETWHSDLLEIGVEQTCTTWLRWRNCFVGTPLALSGNVATRPFQDFASVVQSGAIQELFNWESSPEKRRSVFESKSKTAINGFPHFFGPPAKEDFVKELYLRRLVLDNGFLFGRKFNKGVKVKLHKNRTKVPLAEFLPALWGQVKEQITRKHVWRRLQKGGYSRNQA